MSNTYCKNMERDVDVESLTLWGVLHDGELRRLESDVSSRSLTLEVSVAYLSNYYDWPEAEGILFQFYGLRSSKVNQWIPQPGLGNEDLGSRRWTPRKWEELEGVVPPHSIVISEASISRQKPGVLMEIAGHEASKLGHTNVWLELAIGAEDLQIRTPDGPVDLDRLIQLGDGYWDNLGKKRKR